MAEPLTTLTEGLLTNFGLLALLVSGWIYGLETRFRLSRPVTTLLVAVLCAVAVVLLMGHAFEVGAGLRFDLRSVPLALGPLFGGPVVGLVTLAVAAFLRISAGGATVPNAIAAMVVVTAFGIAGHLLLKGRPVQLWHVMVLSALTASTSLVAVLLLPGAVSPDFPLGQLLVAIAIIFAATSATGVAIVSALRRRTVERENRMYRSVIDSLPEPIGAKDLEGRFMVANPAAARMLNAPDVAAVIGRTESDFLPAGEAVRLERQDALAIASRAPSVIEEPVVSGDGVSRWMASLRAPLFDDHGAIAGLITHHRDVSDRKRLEDEHEIARSRLDDAIASMDDALVIFDRAERIVLCNQRYRDFFPLTRDLRVPGTSLEQLLRAILETGELRIPPGGGDAWLAEMRAMHHAPSERLVELADGRWIHTRMQLLRDGGVLGVMTDVTRSRITEQRLAEANQRLEVLARIDGLTDLTNRRAFEEVFAAEFARSQRSGRPLGLLMLDLDNFKAYNDTYGHLAGDECLRQIAQTLRACLKRPGDLAARFGGEEFVAVLADTDLAGTVERAEAIRSAVRDLAIRHASSGMGIVTVSIGVAVRSGSGPDTPWQLVGSADRALYAAKAAGRDRVVTDGMAWIPGLDMAGAVVASAASRGA